MSFLEISLKIIFGGFIVTMLWENYTQRKNLRKTIKNLKENESKC